MERVTQAFLQATVDRINRMTGSPMEPYKRIDGKLVAQIGNYHISSAYGGVGLQRMHNEAGGVESIIGGYMPKRELADRMRAFIAGLEAGRQS